MIYKTDNERLRIERRAEKAYRQLHKSTDGHLIPKTFDGSFNCNNTPSLLQSSIYHAQ